MSDERFRIAYNAKLADWGEPAWVWHPTPIVDWDETGRFFNNMITDPNERLEDSWEFVRILAINTSQTLFAQRVRYPRYRIGDGSVFDDTEKLDGQDDADYAKVKFEQDGIESVASPIVYKYKRGGRLTCGIFSYSQNSRWVVAEFQAPLPTTKTKERTGSSFKGLVSRLGGLCGT